MFAGFAIYFVGAVLAWMAPNLTWLLAARMLQGLGAAAPRVVALALMRDLYEGRRMAQLSSFVMTVFMIVPAFAPFLGQFFIAAWGWRSIFIAYGVFSVVVALWLRLRQAETHPSEKRRAFTLTNYISGAKDVLSRRDFVLIMLVFGFGFGQMLALLSATQQIYDVTYGRGASFPFWFMLTAACSAVTTVVNGSLVMRVGMKRIAMIAYGGQAAFSSGMFLLFWQGLVPESLSFWFFFAWSVSIFLMAPLTFGNLNALALQPLGHLAGMGASLLSALSTVLSVIIAAPISQSFAGTPVPMMLGATICSVCSLLLLRPVKPVGH
jgi:DHA1 family bicyclomycin/chloramphenicol resistance-like MFS transporter